MRVVGLFHYPVKALRGVAVQALELGPRGPVNDREFMLVDGDGRFVSQRTAPRLATLSARVAPSVLELRDDSDERHSVRLDVQGARRAATIWRDQVDALDCGDEAARWLTARAGVDCRLVRLASDATRLIDAKYRPRPDAQTTFTDGYPLLLTNTASLDDLNTRLERPIGMERFRPNVVVETDTPWAEDDWRRVRLGEVELDLVKPCARCAVITTDQRTGERPDGSAPLSALAAFRTQAPHGAIFGQNAVHAATGTLRLHEAGAVLERRSA
jgi:hypothetical protein